MTDTLQTQQALQTTAQDLRTLGQAAKADFQRIQHDATEMARARVIEPGVQFVKEASHRVEDQARRSAALAKEKIEQVSGYVADNPSRSLLGAFAGGLILGFMIGR